MRDQDGFKPSFFRVEDGLSRSLTVVRTIGGQPGVRMCRRMTVPNWARLGDRRPCVTVMDPSTPRGGSNSLFKLFAPGSTSLFLVSKMEVVQPTVAADWVLRPCGIGFYRGPAREVKSAGLTARGFRQRARLLLWRLSASARWADRFIPATT
jgi:hypothetical protein